MREGEPCWGMILLPVAERGGWGNRMSRFQQRICGWLALALLAAGPVRAALLQDVYVWQRAWSPDVTDAVRSRTSSFRRLIALQAEVTWQGQRPHLTRVALDYEALRQVNCEVGLALRIGPYAGAFHPSGEPVDSLGMLALDILQQAQRHGIRVRELQIDFDCPESKLAGYQVWVEAVRRKVQPTPVTITALPSWTRHRAFAALVRATDGYVLQVHSLNRPAGPDKPLSLCDPEAARQAVAHAEKAGVPFRVALPTYGYQVAFDAQGKFYGLSAEGPARNWPADVQLREVRADPGELADLVRTWKRAPARWLQGLIWYRLPVASDRMNWPWATLAAVVQGRTPAARLQAQSRSDPSGLVDIVLVNTGELEAEVPSRIRLTWTQARVQAADALQGFALVEHDAPTGLEFHSRVSRRRLAPGSECPVGWLRLSRPQAIATELLGD